MGDGGLREIELSLDIAHADLTAGLAEEVHHLQSNRMTKRLEQLRFTLEVGIRR